MQKAGKLTSTSYRKNEGGGWEQKGPSATQAPAASARPARAPAPAAQATAPSARPAPATNGGASRAASGGRFRLFINCTPTRYESQPNSIVYLEELVHEMEKQLAQQQGKQSVYEISFFDRTDTLSPVLMKELSKLGSGDVVIAYGASQDLRRYIDVIRPLAGDLIEMAR